MSTVAHRERSRLLEAMLTELVEKGYPAVEVKAAAHRAHLSGAEWQAEFPDKDTCLVAAFDQLSVRLRLAIRDGCAAGSGWIDRVAGGLRALLGELSKRATTAEALARTFPAIGPEFQVRYQRFIEGLAPFLAEGREISGMAAELPGEVELLAVGAAEAIVLGEIQAGRTARLLDLGPEILFSLLVPFLGAPAAAEAMETERERGLQVASRGWGRA